MLPVAAWARRHGLIGAELEPVESSSPLYSGVFIKIQAFLLNSPAHKPLTPGRCSHQGIAVSAALALRHTHKPLTMIMM